MLLWMAVRPEACVGRRDPSVHYRVLTIHLLPISTRTHMHTYDHICTHMHAYDHRCTHPYSHRHTHTCSLTCRLAYMLIHTHRHTYTLDTAVPPAPPPLWRHRWPFDCTGAEASIPTHLEGRRHRGSLQELALPLRR